MPEDTDTIEQLFALARVARLATTGTAGPHLVPVVFALADGVVYTAVDGKPKTTRNLRRLRNIADHSEVSVLVDHYDEDWSQLWWVRVDGVAGIPEAGSVTGTAGIDALAAKYPQYRSVRPAGPVIAIEPVRWRSWRA